MGKLSHHALKVKLVDKIHHRHRVSLEFHTMHIIQSLFALFAIKPPVPIRIPTGTTPEDLLAPEDLLVRQFSVGFGLEIVAVKDGRYLTKAIQTVAIRRIFPLIRNRGFSAFDGPCTLFLFDNENGEEMSGPRWVVGPGAMEELELMVMLTVNDVQKTIIASPSFKARDGFPSDNRSHSRLLSAVAANDPDSLKSVPRDLLIKLLADYPI